MAKRLALIAAGVGAGLLAREWFRRANAMDLRHAVVLITGGSRGLGLALAEEFAREGARVAICARDEAELGRAAERIERLGAEVLAVRCDVGDRDAVHELIRRVTDRWQRLDVLVNNAGVIQVGPLETQMLDDFDEAMGTMFWGTVYTTLTAMPRMIGQRSGRIVNITSIGGKVAVPHLLPYTAAKFAAAGFSEGLKTELARHGVSVVTVVPGLMRTGSFVNALFKGRHRLEYGLFSPMSSLPFLTIDAREAARKIVAATRRGDAEITLTVPANLLARFHGLFPGLTADLMGLTNRLLPGTDGIGASRALGKESETAFSRSFLTALGRAAAYDLNQYAPDDGASVSHSGEQPRGLTSTVEGVATGTEPR